LGTTSSTNAVSAAQKPPSFQGSQVTVSENHPLWNKRKAKSKSRVLQDVGGGFSSRKRYVTPANLSGYTSVFVNDSSTQKVTSTYKGICLPTLTGVGFPPYADSNSLGTWGTTAIAKCKPTNSVADLGVGLAELLREGVPKLLGSSLWKDGIGRARKAPAEEYLNLEFGYKPLANDIASLMSGIYRANLLLQQYERDSGKVVRRRYEFPPESEYSEIVLKTGVSPWTAPSGGAMYNTQINQGRVIRIFEKKIRRWFSGAFTYYLPSGYDSRNEMDRKALLIKKILGLELNPEVLWNLAPWSWAADWFSNAGDVLSNISDWQSDGLVLRYGYIMEHSIASYTYTFDGPTGFRGSLQPVPLTFVSEAKKREKATPFGFGLTWGGLTPRQLAIAAALGLTKS